MPELFAHDFAHLVVLVIISWLSGKVLRLFGMSEIIANVGTGVLFGPMGLAPLIGDNQGLNLLKFIGVWGVAFLLLGSGLESSFESMRTTGLKAVGVGIIGTIGPYVLGFLTCILLMSFSISEEKGWKSAISMGTVLAPTSIAVPLSVFVTYRYVTKPIGQVVLNAAVLDDIFSIILLSILQSLGDTKDQTKQEIALQLCLKLLYNVIMIVGAGILGRFVMPRWGLDAFHFLSDRLGDDRRDMIQVTSVFSTTIFLSYVASLFHCDLLGPFCAGVIFCELPRSETLLHHQTKVMVKWMIRLFFTFSVGCGVPARDLFLWEAFWKGLVIFIVPAFAGKLLCGFFHQKDFLMTGIAMSGRGEFAFVCLESARTFLEPALAAALVWTLLLSMLICPLALSYLITKQIQCRTGIRHLKLEIHTKRKRDLALEINEFMHEEEFTIRTIRYDTTPKATVMHYTIFVENCINEEEVKDLEHRLKDLLDDYSCEVRIHALNDVEEEFDEEDPSIISHSFLLKWVIPTIDRKKMKKADPNMRLSSPELEQDASSRPKTFRITPWILIDKIDRELDKHNLIMTCVKVKKLSVFPHQIQFEATIFVRLTEEGVDLQMGRSFAEDRSLQELAADPISKMGMHVLKKVLHAYHVSGVTDFKQNTNSLPFHKTHSMNSLKWGAS